MTRHRALAPLLAAILLLAGCAVLPTDDRVRQGAEIDSNPLREPPAVAVKGPSEGAPADVILRDFLRAMADSTDDYRVARQFLTPAASDAWHPSTGSILVYEGESSTDILSRGERTEATVVKQVTVTGYAVLDTAGSFRLESTGSKKSATITLTRIKGEWRVNELPRDFGRWISQAEFARVFVRLNVYYASPIDNVLIPDPRWVPRGDALVTALARLQADDPPEYLRGAVRTGLPSGSQLEVDSVAVQDRVATVRLKGDAQSALTEEQRGLIQAQYLQALVQQNLVDGVRIQWRGTTLDQGNASAYTTAGRTPPFLLLRTEQGLGPVTLEGTGFKSVDLRDSGLGDSGRSPMALPKMPQLDPGWVQLAANVDGRILAGVGRDGRTFTTWYNGVPGPVRSTPGGLTTPSFDDGSATHDMPSAPGAWFASTQRGASQVWWVDLTTPDAPAAPRLVKMPWLGRGQVVALRVAPDATRVAMLVRDAGRGGVVVAISAVLRDQASGKPLALTAPRVVGAPMHTAQDLSWTKSDQLVVLGQDVFGSVTRPLYLLLGGDVTRGTPLPAAALVTARYGEGDRGILLTDEKGTCYQKVGDGWAQTAADAEVITPGE